MAKKLDMINSSLWDKILLFAFPVAATAILSQLFNAADIAVVGNFTGDQSTAAVAAVGANSPIISLIVNLFTGIALGANVVIAHAVGQGNKVTVKKAVHTSIVISFLAGLVIAVLGELFSANILSVMKVPEDVFDMALLYLRIYLIGLPVILLYNFEAAIFRSVGETKVPLLVLTASGIMNVILNIILVAGFHMTVDGVAIATVISNAFSAVVLYVLLRRSKLDIMVTPSELKISPSAIKRILSIGLPSGIQSAVFALSNIIIQTAVNNLGTDVMAASSAAYNIEIICYFVYNAFSQACTTFVGQNYGADKLDRCKKVLKLCLLEGFIAYLISMSAILIFGKNLLYFFDKNPAVIQLGYTRLVVIMLAYFFSQIYETMSGYMRGFGISLAPALLTMLSVCGIRISWIKFVFPLSPSFNTIMTVYPISLCTNALFISIALICTRPVSRLMKKQKTKNAV